MRISEELRYPNPDESTCLRAADVIEELHRRILRINDLQRYLMGVGSDGSGPYANERNHGEWLMRKDVLSVLIGNGIPERTYDGDHTLAWIDNGDDMVQLEDIYFYTDEPDRILHGDFCGGSRE